MYKDPDGVLSGPAGVFVSADSSSGEHLAGVLWSPPIPARGLVVELHNLNGAAAEAQVAAGSITSYDSEYRKKALMANSLGFAYLYVDCDSANLVTEDRDQQARFGVRLSDLVNNVQLSLHIQSRQTLLVAYSLGAAVALSSVVEAPNRYGVVTLVGLPDAIAKEFGRQLPSDNGIRAIVVECSGDFEGTAPGMISTKNDLIHVGFHPERIQTLTLADVHLLMHPTSWISIEAAIFESLESQQR